jgi:hypothetical protein
MMQKGAKKGKVGFPSGPFSCEKKRRLAIFLAPL